MLFEDLRARYLENRRVVFVGAGVSAAGGLPSWSGLIQHVLANTRAAASTAELPALAEAEATLTRGDLIRALGEVQATTTSASSPALAGLPWRATRGARNMRYDKFHAAAVLVTLVACRVVEGPGTMTDASSSGTDGASTSSPTSTTGVTTGASTATTTGSTGSTGSTTGPASSPCGPGECAAGELCFGRYAGDDGSAEPDWTGWECRPLPAGCDLEDPCAPACADLCPVKGCPNQGLDPCLGWYYSC